MAPGRSVSPKYTRQKGRRAENAAAKELNRQFKRLGSTLTAKRVLRSGAWGHWDRRLKGDVQIIDRGGRIVEFVEVKIVTPGRRSGPITIALMDGRKWRKSRRCLMCREGPKPFLCSVWAPVWNELVLKTGQKEPDLITRQCSTRGVTVDDIQADMILNMPVFWGAAIYMTVRAFAELLDAAYGEALK